jgi:uncharacterized protein with HEPN domain
MKPALKKRLVDALQATQTATDFCHGKNLEQYRKDNLLRSGVERQLEILGEALNRALTEEPGLETKIPEARRIVGIRNRIIHGYDSVDDEILWEVVTTKLKPLAALLTELVAES